MVRSGLPLYLISSMLCIGLNNGLSLAFAENTDSQAVATTIGEAQLSRSEQHQVQAQQWQLSKQEWQRYQSLMQGIRGSLSVSTISPLEVLGIHARNASERRHYAERWAQLMHQDAQRVLAFQHAYDQAFARLYGQEKFIDLNKLPGQAPALTLQFGDRVMFFTRIECVLCDLLLPRLLNVVRMQAGVGLDIYLQDSSAGDEEKIRAWAKRQAIPPELVRNKVITLNHDNGLLVRLFPDTDAPHIVQRRADKLTIVTPANLRRLQ